MLENWSSERSSNSSSSSNYNNNNIIIIIIIIIISAFLGFIGCDAVQLDTQLLYLHGICSPHVQDI